MIPWDLGANCSKLLCNFSTLLLTYDSTDVAIITKQEPFLHYIAIVFGEHCYQTAQDTK